MLACVMEKKKAEHLQSQSKAIALDASLKSDSADSAAVDAEAVDVYAAGVCQQKNKA